MKKEKQEKVKKEKKPLSKKAKIWIALGTSFVFIVACVGTLLAVLLSPKLRWHGLSIANFENYTGIGAASFGKGEGSTAVAYASDGGAGKKEMKLAGITKENQCREIEFENDKGKIVKQNAHLILFCAYENFTFLGFSTNKNKEFIEIDNLANFSITNMNKYCYVSYTYADDEMQIAWDKSCHLFVLDNKTGNIYNIYEVLKAMTKFSNVDYVSAQLINLGENGSYVAGSNEFVNQEKIFFEVNGYTWETQNQIQTLVRIDFDKEDIKVVEAMNDVQFRNFYNGGQFSHSDKYGNVVEFYEIDKVKYQKFDGTFVVPTSTTASYKFGFNNILYKKENNKTFYLNQAGEFEEIDFDFESVLEGFNFCKKNGNVIYGTGHKNSYPNYELLLYKITLDDEYDWKYSVESELVINESGYQTAVCGKYLFLFTNNKIKKYDMETKTLSDYESDYTFKKMKYYKNTDIIKFKAIDGLTLLEVDGYIDENGEIQIGDFAGVKKGLNRVYIVKPLN